MEKVGGDSSASIVRGKNEKTSAENQCKGIPHHRHKRKEHRTTTHINKESRPVRTCVQTLCDSGGLNQVAPTQ